MAEDQRVGRHGLVKRTPFPGVPLDRSLLGFFLTLPSRAPIITITSYAISKILLLGGIKALIR
jgi:hypothetical protein